MIRSLSIATTTAGTTLASVLLYQISEENLPIAPWITVALFLMWSLTAATFGAYLTATRE